MVNSHVERRKKLATLHKSTIAVSPDPLRSSERDYFITCVDFVKESCAWEREADLCVNYLSTELPVKL